MNAEVGIVVENLQDYLSMRHPSVQWEVTHESSQATPEPIIHIAARRHPFQPFESAVRCSFGLWSCVNPATGEITPRVWASWATKTLGLLQVA